MTDTQRDHGTEAAYKRHLRQGSAPCAKCRRAVTEANQRRLANEEICYAGAWVRDGLIWRPTEVAS